MSDYKISLKNHNKKRNSGLLFEFIVNKLSESITKNDQKSISKCNELIEKYFNNKTELFKEYRIINSIVKTAVSSENVANSILKEMRQYVNKFDRNALNTDKNNLVHELNKNFGESIYEQHINNYKIYATTQMLINNMMSESPDPVISGKYRDVVIKHLLENKEEDIEQEIINETAPVSDKRNSKIIVKLMNDRLNKKYGNVLTKSQKNFLKEYIAGDNSNNKFLENSFNNLKTNLTESLDKYLSIEKSDVVKGRIKTLIENLAFDKFDQNNKNLYFAKCLEILKLNDELNGN
jgi:predicted DNA-binding protein YlxM (UPF0122 family)